MLGRGPTTQNTVGLGDVKEPGRDKPGKSSRVPTMKCFVGHTEEFRYVRKLNGSTEGF